MKRILSLSIVAIITIYQINAQKLENSTLWKIEGKGLNQPSYLFGTIHITCDATLEADVKQALDKTTQIVMELDMDDPSMTAKMMTGSYLSNGQTIKDFISEDDYMAVDSLFMNQLGMSISFMTNVKPIALTAMLYPRMIDCPLQSFELALMQAVETQSKTIYGLETIEEQLKVFEDIPLKDQYADLVRMAKDNLEYDKTNFSKMLDIYGDEDISALLEMMNDQEYQTVAEHQEILLENRNKNWIPKMETYAKDQATFFAVGAGHLAGKNGVINLLRVAGYTVSAVPD